MGYYVCLAVLVSKVSGFYKVSIYLLLYSNAVPQLIDRQLSTAALVLFYEEVMSTESFHFTILESFPQLLVLAICFQIVSHKV